MQKALPAKNRTVRWAVWATVVLILVQLGFWWFSARHTLDGYVWSAMLLAGAAHPAQNDFEAAACISVPPGLYAQAPEHLKNRVRGALASNGTELVVAEPTHSSETRGVLDRACVELFEAPEGWGGINAPFVSSATLGYYLEDSNGDALLMLQIGPRWIRIGQWSAWL